MIVSTHRIGGITLRTETDVSIPHIQRGFFSNFLVSSGKPDAFLNIRGFNRDSFILPPLDKHERQCVIRCVDFQKHWLDNPIFQSPDVRRVVMRCLDRPELVHIALNWNRAIFRNYAHNEITLFYPPEKRKEFANPLFHARYRNLFFAFLPCFSALLIHGAGIIRKDRAVVFLAQGGGGKTTVANHALSETILSDDQIILYKNNNRITVHSTPFGAKGQCPQHARLSGLFLLEKACHFELIPLKPGEILQFIWKEHFHNWYVLPRELRIRAFDILYHACTRVPVYKMRFPKDYVDWDAIDRAME